MPHGGGLGGLLGAFILLTLTCVVCGQLFKGLDGDTTCKSCQRKAEKESESDSQSESRPSGDSDSKESQSIFDMDIKMFPDDN